MNPTRPVNALGQIDLGELRRLGRDAAAAGNVYPGSGSMVAGPFGAAYLAPEVESTDDGSFSTDLTVSWIDPNGFPTSVTVTDVTLLSFDRSDGFLVSTGVTGQAKIDMLPSTRLQAGGVSLATHQHMGSGQKTFDYVFLGPMNTDGTVYDHDVGLVGDYSTTPTGLWGLNNPILRVRRRGGATGSLAASLIACGGIDGQSAAFGCTLSHLGSLMGLFSIFSSGYPLIASVGMATIVSLGRVWGATGFRVGEGNGTDGVSGSFTTADGKTVTVTGGIITSIV